MTKNERLELLNFLNDLHHGLDTLVGNNKLQYATRQFYSRKAKELSNGYCTSLLELSEKLINQIEKEVK